MGTQSVHAEFHAEVHAEFHAEVHAEVHTDFRIAAWAVGRYDKNYLWSLMKIVRIWLATMECRLLCSAGLGLADD